MVIPVVTGDLDPGAVEDLIALCVGYHGLRTQAAPAAHGPTAAGPLSDVESKMSRNSGTTLGPNSMRPAERLTASGVDGPLGEHHQVRQVRHRNALPPAITPSSPFRRHNVASSSRLDRSGRPAATRSRANSVASARGG